MQRVLYVPVTNYDQTTASSNNTTSSPSRDTTEVYQECVQKKHAFTNSFIQWYSMIISYVLPSCVLIICYIKILMYMSSKAQRLARNFSYNGRSRVSVHRKRKVTRTVIFLTLTFIVLWFPVHFLATWYRLDKNFPMNTQSYFFKLVAHTMTYANPSVNPLIYGFSNESFRLSLSHFMRKCLYKKKLTIEIDTRASHMKRSLSAKEETLRLAKF
jgi:hypothetical protein